MHIDVLPTCVPVHKCMPDACGNQKTVLDPLELELQKVVSHHVGTGNQTQVLCKNECP